MKNWICAISVVVAPILGYIIGWETRPGVTIMNTKIERVYVPVNMENGAWVVNGLNGITHMDIVACRIDSSEYMYVDGKMIYLYNYHPISAFTKQLFFTEAEAKAELCRRLEEKMKSCK